MVKVKEFGADFRSLAIEHYMRGDSLTEIGKHLANKVHRTTISRWIKDYERNGLILNCYIIIHIFNYLFLAR